MSFEQVVKCHFGLDIVPVHIVRQSTGRDERKVDGALASLLGNESIAPVQHATAFFPVNFVFTGRILHLTYIDSIVSPFDQKVYLCTMRSGTVFPTNILRTPCI